MDELTKLEQLLADDYLVVGPILPLSKIRRETIDNFVSVFSVELRREILLDRSNRAKSLIILRHRSTGHQVEILTSDERTIRQANEQRHYQEEQIGILIHAHCAALGGRFSDQGRFYPNKFHLDDLVASLDGLWGWQFTLGDVVGTCKVVIRLKSTDRRDALEAVDKLQHLLDCLAVSQQVGFQIQHRSIAPIQRLEPTVSVTSLEERMLPPVTSEEIGSSEAILSSPTKARIVGHYLNQAYGENYMPNRLSTLWTAAEYVFGGTPKHLLMEKEIRYLLHSAEGIESLRNDSDRLRELKEALQNPNRLPLETRNKRMAKTIAHIMGMRADDAYSKIREASELRGKLLHTYSANWEGIENSVKFLEEALSHYLARQKTS